MCGGIVFVRRDAVRGLTTAATGWLTCAVGMACGGGLPVLALAATALHFLVVRGWPLLLGKVVPSPAPSVVELHLTCRTGSALLPRLMETCAQRGFSILQVKVQRLPGRTDSAARGPLELEASADTGQLTSALFQNDCVIELARSASSGDE